MPDFFLLKPPLPDILVFRADKPDLRQVDILVAKTSFEADVLRSAEMVAVESVNVPVARAEAVVVYNLLADRPRDRDDIRAILNPQARAVRQLLPLLLDAQFAGGEGQSDGTPIFGGAHPVQYFGAADPSVEITATPGGPVPVLSRGAMVVAVVALGMVGLVGFARRAPSLA